MAPVPRKVPVHRQLAFAVMITGFIVASCGSDDVAAQADRVAEPTAIAAPSGVDASGAELTLEVIDGGSTTGLVMTDYRGFAVYGLTGESATSLVCVDDCTTVWIPLTPRAGGVASALDMTKYQVIERPDGSGQAAYDGIPLYLWTGDDRVGVTGGAGVAGTWFALTETGGHIG